MSTWRNLRSSFPITEVGIHLDHARVAPLPCRVDEAVRAFVDEATRRRDSAAEARVRSEIERVRGRVGELLGAAPEEVAFVSNAVRGLGLVADDVAWRRGDLAVLAGDGMGVAGKALTRRGVETRHVPLSQGAFSLARIEAALRHPRVRLLALTAVEAESGARAPLPAVAELCADRGVLLCVDASHQAGSLPISLRGDGIDYLIADGHRFLMGLAGTGLLLRNTRVAPRPEPAAARFESGPRNELGIVALGAAVDLLLELSIAGVEKRVLELTDRLVEGLAARDVEPAVPRGAARSAIVTFRLGEEPAARTAERLRSRRICVSALASGVRVSPHAYNLPDEIDALLDVL